MSTDLRWIKFWPQDWQRDPALRMCSLAARGLWIDLLCIMHEGNPYGHLTVSGCAPTHRQIAAIVGSTEREIDKLIAELASAWVLSRTSEGIIFSRRMVRDKATREVGQRNGKNGGNPVLRKDLTPIAQMGLTPPLNIQEAEAEAEIEAEKKEPPSLRSASPKVRRARTQIPKDWHPNQAGIDKATQCGIKSIFSEAERFRDYHAGKGNLMADWDAAWRTWCGNALKFAKPEPETAQAKLLRVMGLDGLDDDQPEFGGLLQ